jgi:hypothetical protein
MKNAGILKMQSILKMHKLKFMQERKFDWKFFGIFECR